MVVEAVTLMLYPPSLLFCRVCFKPTPENQLLLGKCYQCAGMGHIDEESTARLVAIRRGLRCEMCGGLRSRYSGRFCRPCYRQRATARKEVTDTREAVRELRRALLRGAA